MTISAKRLHPLFAAELTGADLTAGIDPATRDAIEDAMDEHAVCVLPGQRLDDDKQIAFASLYGPLEVSPPVHSKAGGAAADFRIQNRHIFDVSNLDERAAILPLDDQRRAYRQGNELWHTDSSFRQKSATWSMLHARMIPPDGADTRVRRHPRRLRRVARLHQAQARGAGRRALDLALARAVWRLHADRRGNQGASARAASVVRRHPGSGRKALYIASHASHIIGWPVEEGRALLRELLAHATQPRFVYAPQMAARRPGDLGQPLHPAPRHAVRVGDARPRHAPQHRDRYPLCRSNGELT